MEFPLIVSEPKCFDNYVIYLRDANKEYIGYLMCPSKKDAMQLADVLKKWSETQIPDK
jgi:L-rhamnose mutarotase